MKMMKEMKIIILVFSAILFLSCTDKPIESEKTTTDSSIISTESNSNIESVTHTPVVYDNHVNLDIDFIKANSKKGFSDFNMDSLWKRERKINKIENKDLLSILSKIHVNGNEKWTLYTGKNDPIWFHEWEEDGNFFIFSILQQDEVCCLTMHLVSFNKKNNELNISQLALSGGDGGWSGNEQGRRTGFGKFTISGISEEENELQTDAGEPLSKIITETYKIQYNLIANGLLQGDTLDISMSENIIEKQ